MDESEVVVSFDDKSKINDPAKESELENLNKQQIPKEIVNQVNGTPVAPPPVISAKVPTSKTETKSETKETTKETNQEKLIRLFGSPNKRQ